MYASEREIACKKSVKRSERKLKWKGMSVEETCAN